MAVSAFFMWLAEMEERRLSAGLAGFIRGDMRVFLYFHIPFLYIFVKNF